MTWPACGFPSCVMRMAQLFGGHVPEGAHVNALPIPPPAPGRHAHPEAVVPHVEGAVQHVTGVSVQFVVVELAPQLFPPGLGPQTPHGAPGSSQGLPVHCVDAGALPEHGSRALQVEQPTSARTVAKTSSETSCPGKPPPAPADIATIRQTNPTAAKGKKRHRMKHLNV